MIDYYPRLKLTVNILKVCCYNTSYSSRIQPTKWQQKKKLEERTKPTTSIYFVSELIHNLFEDYAINLHSSINLFIMVLVV